MSMQDKIAVVTGAASGIGRATAQALAEAGARVILADIDGDKGGGRGRGICAQRGEKAEFMRRRHDGSGVDRGIRRGRAGSASARSTCSSTAPGWGRTAPFWEGTPEFWSKLVALNFVGPMLLCKALAAGDDGARAAAGSSTSPAMPDASAAWARRCIPAPRAA